MQCEKTEKSLNFIGKKGVYGRYLPHSNFATLNHMEDKATKTPIVGVLYYSTQRVCCSYIIQLSVGSALLILCGGQCEGLNAG